MNNVTVIRTRKALGTMLREALEASNRPVVITYAVDGRMCYTVDGDVLSPGKAAERLGIIW